MHPPPLWRIPWTLLWPLLEVSASHHWPVPMHPPPLQQIPGTLLWRLLEAPEALRLLPCHSRPVQWWFAVLLWDQMCEGAPAVSLGCAALLCAAEHVECPGDISFAMGCRASCTCMMPGTFSRSSFCFCLTDLIQSLTEAAGAIQPKV